MKSHCHYSGGSCSSCGACHPKQSHSGRHAKSQQLTDVKRDNYTGKQSTCELIHWSSCQFEPGCCNFVSDIPDHRLPRYANAATWCYDQRQCFTRYVPQVDYLPLSVTFTATAVSSDQTLLCETGELIKQTSYIACSGDDTKLAKESTATKVVYDTWWNSDCKSTISVINTADLSQRWRPDDIKNISSVSTTQQIRGIKRRTTVDETTWSPYQKKSKKYKCRRSDFVLGNFPENVQSTLKIADIQKISEEILTVCATQQQCKDVYSNKMKLRDCLYDIIKQLFPYCGLYVIGSSMNGFGSAVSDIDFCLMLSHSEIDQKREAMDILRIIQRSLMKCEFLHDLRLIHARVPILKFRDRLRGFECDLNINNAVGIRNTHLLSAYCYLDWRLSPLVIFVKMWAKVQGINDASQGTISSYSLTLMVIHYLQYGCRPGALPSLQQKYPHKFTSTQDVRLLTLSQKLAPYTSSNQESVGQLFVGFLRYFATGFKFEKDVISVRLGKAVAKSDLIPQFSEQDADNVSLSSFSNQWKYLCIEEPFTLSNTAYSVYDFGTFERIRRVFQRSYEMVVQTGDTHQITKCSLVPF